MKEIKNKVGRPKLADKSLKKESLLVSCFCLVFVCIIGYLAFLIISSPFDTKYLVGTIYNNHIDSCVIESSKIDCGPNVNYMKYKIDDGQYVEYTKSDRSIEVEITKYKSIDICYKNNNNKLTCVK